MCGIFGVFDTRATLKDHVRRLDAARDELSHRGPDDYGSFLSPEGNVYLGHRRLAIIDLEKGQQPIFSEDGRYAIIFNGEIYNYLSLRQSLLDKGYSFRTNSDTEVLLYHFIANREDYYKAIKGPYAFAVYDKEEERLFLSRDPSGQKPIYYTKRDGQFVFASELAALKSWCGEEAFELSLEGIHLYLNNHLVPPPYTIFKNVFKMMPGSEIVWEKGQLTERNILPDFFNNECEQPDLMELLDRTVKLELTSDVPVAVILSGGIDSSIVTALAVRHHPQIHTFSIFSEETEDQHPDLVFSRRVAEQLGTRHREIRFSASDCLKYFHLIQKHYGEPFSRLPICYWSMLFSEIKKDFKVVLSGNGGDELFGGYPQTYRNVRSRMSLWQQMILKTFPVSLGDRIYSWLSQRGGSSEALLKIFYLLSQPVEERSEYLRSYQARGINHFLRKEYKALSFNPDSIYRDSFQQAGGMDILKKWMFTDIAQRNQEIMTINADIVGMAHSLEVRSPLLNQNLLRYFYKHPSRDFIDAKTYKKPLVPILRELNLEYLINRPKIGFDGGVPHDLTNEILEAFREKVPVAKRNVFQEDAPVSAALRLKECILSEYLTCR